MSKPLSERLEELVQGCHGPRSSVIREAIALARRVEGATEGYVERLGDCPVRKRPRALVLTTREAIINGNTRVMQMVRLVPEV